MVWFGLVWAGVYNPPPPRLQVPIILSWFTSPLLCGLATVALYVVLRSAVLRRENSLRLTYMVGASKTQRG